VATLVLFAAGAQAAPVPDEDALRREAVQLNNANLQGDDDEAVKRESVAKHLEPLLKDKDRAKKLLAVAVATAKGKDQPFNFTGAYLLGCLAREFQDVEAGKVFFRICIDKAEKLKSDRRVALAFLDLIDLLFENRKFAEAEKVCKEMLEQPGGPDLNRGKIIALLRQVEVLALQDKTDEAFKVLDPFLKTAGDQPLILQTHGWLLHRAEKFDEAAKAYEKLITVVDDEKEKDQARYVLSNLYAELGDIDKATTQLQTLLKKEPDSATYNNDLGYIWADHDRNLDEAEAMIKTALDMVPKNGAYLDSMGWVLFK
jgi:tetratricopeptide (TPR) repeat protein